MDMHEYANPDIEIEVIGSLWQPGFRASNVYHPRIVPPDRLTAGSIDGEFTRKNVEDWLARNAGDFSGVDDFHAVLSYTKEKCECCGQPVVGLLEIPWQDEESECVFGDAMFPE